MGFHEKSALACLLSIGLIYVPYFLVVWRYPMAALGLFWIAAAGLAILLTLFHLVNAIASRSIRTTGDTPAADELDDRIELEAAKWAGFTLAFAVLVWILMVMYSMPILGARVLENAKAIDGQLSPSLFAVPVIRAMGAVHWLFAAFVLANIAYYGGIVIRYRRLASA